LREDIDNVFVTLTARGMAPDIFITARASNKQNESKLLRAGADKVILVNEVAGHHMANIILRPDVMTFLNELTGLHNRSLGLREIKITEGCDWENKTIGDLEIRAETGLNVVSIRQGDKKFNINPGPDVLIKKDDVLIVFGSIEAANKTQNKLIN